MSLPANVAAILDQANGKQAVTPDGKKPSKDEKARNTARHTVTDNVTNDNVTLAVTDNGKLPPVLLRLLDLDEQIHHKAHKTDVLFDVELVAIANELKDLTGLSVQAICRTGVRWLALALINAERAVAVDQADVKKAYRARAKLHEKSALNDA